MKKLHYFKRMTYDLLFYYDCCCFFLLFFTYTVGYLKCQILINLIYFNEFFFTTLFILNINIIHILSCKFEPNLIEFPIL